MTPRTEDYYSMNRVIVYYTGIDRGCVPCIHFERLIDFVESNDIPIPIEEITDEYLYENIDEPDRPIAGTYTPSSENYVLSTVSEEYFPPVQTDDPVKYLLKLGIEWDLSFSSSYEVGEKEYIVIRCGFSDYSTAFHKHNYPKLYSEYTETSCPTLIFVR